MKEFSLDEARQVIRDVDPQYIDAVLAAATITSSRSSSFEDLLECLRFPGPPASMAACTLYSRTKRSCHKGRFSEDYDDWRQYLDDSGSL